MPLYLPRDTPIVVSLQYQCLLFALPCRPNRPGVDLIHINRRANDLPGDVRHVLEKSATFMPMFARRIPPLVSRECVEYFVSR
jgi:hypothetical protein